MSRTDCLPSLHVLRLPGATGPILSCRGVVTEGTVGRMASELERLATLEHLTLTVDFSGCHFGDVDGMLGVLELLQRLGEERHRLVVVSGTDRMARLLKVAGIDQLLPLFATTEEAASMLQLGVPPPATTETWAEARDRTVEYWREIGGMVDYAPPQEIMRELTLSTALCERAEALSRRHSGSASLPCVFCPLFEALGEGPEAVGCRCLQDPLLGSVRVGDRTAARALAARAVWLIEEMPLPEETPQIAPARC